MDVRSLTTFARDVTSAEVASKAMMVAATESSYPELFGAAIAVLIHADGHIETMQKDLSNACLHLVRAASPPLGLNPPAALPSR